MKKFFTGAVIVLSILSCIFGLFDLFALWILPHKAIFVLFSNPLTANGFLFSSVIFTLALSLALGGLIIITAKGWIKWMALFARIYQTCL